MQCPFCADDKLEVVLVKHEPREYVMRCQECGARGPAGNAEREIAVDAWNVRYGRLTVVK